jgi:pyridoxal phosphate enzyme (YggS family)
MNHIAENITKIKQEIKATASPGASLIAVSKFFSVSDISTAYKSGIINFAENFPQEFEAKAIELQNQQDIIWHFIGNIQSNKTKIIAQHASFVHSLTKQQHAKRLNDQRPVDKPNLKVLIEVNISFEESKHGLTNFDEIFSLAKFIKQLPRLELVGLMGMASNTADVNKLTQEFQLLNQIKDKLNNNGFNLTELSIGTSNDYLIALNNNSTMIRIGSKIFGERKYDN